MALPTPYSYRTYEGDGATQEFSVPFPYIVREHVRVYIDWDVTTNLIGSELDEGDDFTWVGDTLVSLAVAPLEGQTVSVVRTTPIDQQVTLWQAGSPPTAFELNAADRQVLFAVQEYIDRVAAAQDAIEGGNVGVTVQNLTFTQSGTGAITRSVDSKLKDAVSFNDFGAAGDAARINQALATGRTVHVPKGSYTLEADVQPVSGGIFIDPAASIANPERLIPRGVTSDWANGVNLWRFQDRVFIGGDVKVSPTRTPGILGSGIAGNPQGINSDYLERSAALLASSAYGGVGATFGAHQSRAYSMRGYAVWKPGIAVVAGDKYGYQEKLYTATSSGTTGGTPPTHDTGTASDGVVSWQFDDYTYMVPIGLASVADADIEDGHSCWALYLEGLRRSGGGTLLTSEIAVKNKGSSVPNYPNLPLPGGATIGFWFAGGGDSRLGAPANPSTAAIVIGKNASTWHRGIVFASDGLSPEKIAVALGEGHAFSWFSDNNVQNAYIKSTRTGAASGLSFLEFFNGYSALGVDGSLALVVSVSAGTNNTWIQASGGNEVAYLNVGSASADAKLILGGKGSGRVRLDTPLELGYSGFAVASNPANFGDPGRYIVVYDGAGVPFYIPAKANPW